MMVIWAPVCCCGHDLSDHERRQKEHPCTVPECKCYEFEPDYEEE